MFFKNEEHKKETLKVLKNNRLVLLYITYFLILSCFPEGRQHMHGVFFYIMFSMVLILSYYLLKELRIINKKYK